MDDKSRKANLHNSRFVTIDFGDPEAEHDRESLRRAFYESTAWQKLQLFPDCPYIVGRKGSGKSALVTKLELNAQIEGISPFISLVPSNFRHVEVRQHLERLISRDASWNYVYQIVWKGILVGQVVRFIIQNEDSYLYKSISLTLRTQIDEFRNTYPFYVHDLEKTLTSVVSDLVKKGNIDHDPRILTEMRARLEPRNYKQLMSSYISDIEEDKIPKLTLTIDGLDDNWDDTPPSLHFLAVLLPVVKKLTNEFRKSVRYLVCLRDNILRALIDSRSIEYDKLESLFIRCEWNSRSLFDLICKRAFPHLPTDQAADALLNLLPLQVEGLEIRDYIGKLVQSRPRDYINFFKLLQHEVGDNSAVSEVHVVSAKNEYSSSRLSDLENEFAFTYPGIRKVIETFGVLPREFNSNEMLSHLTSISARATLRDSAKQLFLYYGEPAQLAMILVSVGAIGVWNQEDNAYDFIHEFSQSRVSRLINNGVKFCLHPVYRSSLGLDNESTSRDVTTIRVNPADRYNAVEQDKRVILTISEHRVALQKQLEKDIQAIVDAPEYWPHFEKWVKEAFAICFSDDLSEPKEAIRLKGTKVQSAFSISSAIAPWPEFTSRCTTPLLLIGCSNVRMPSEVDISELSARMEALNLRIALLAYRGDKREPTRDIIVQVRKRFIDSGGRIAIIAITDSFIKQLLRKSDEEQCRSDLDSLLRTYFKLWLKDDAIKSTKAKA